MSKNTNDLQKIAKFIGIAYISSLFLSILVTKIQFIMEQPNETVSNISFIRLILLSLIPSIFNLIIWGGLIFYIIYFDVPS